MQRNDTNVTPMILRDAKIIRHQNKKGLHIFTLEEHRKRYPGIYKEVEKPQETVVIQYHTFMLLRSLFSLRSMETGLDMLISFHDHYAHYYLEDYLYFFHNCEDDPGIEWVYENLNRMPRMKNHSIEIPKLAHFPDDIEHALNLLLYKQGKDIFF